MTFFSVRPAQAFLSLCCVSGLLWGQGRESDKVARTGNVHPLTARASSSKEADPQQMLENLVLALQASPEQEAALERLIAEQSDPESPNYHQYLTPQEYAARFGVSAAEVAKVTAWLENQGLRVEEVFEGNNAIRFRGTVGQVARAFETEMRQYMVNGARHLANATDPKIPAALAGTVGGVLRLHDFEYQAFSRESTKKLRAEGVSPAFSPLGIRWLAPGDYYTIYDMNPLLNAGIDGTGQSIAVLARSNIYVSDVRSFRTMFGLKANDPQIIVTNNDPGQVNGDNVETTLDAEWAGAVAPGATVKVIVSASSSTADGIDLSALYAVNKNVAPIITVSYGACEAQMGTTALTFYNGLWKQAAAQGQTVLVASGDSGVAGCEAMSAAKATKAPGVNGLCSSPFSTCVGGTQFVEGANPGQYWLPSSPGSTVGSAISYIPETVWNESGTVTGGGGLAAGGGGASIAFAKPVWQTGVGVPADGKRDVPDVSLTASAHDGYTVVQGGMIGYIFGVSGTSASAPSFAGMMALVNQQTKSAQGNINPTLYALAAKQAAGGAAVFHDVKTGDNSVPGLKGFAATTGYDLATGLGSVDANLLVTMWNSGTSKPAPLSVAAGALNVNAGQVGTTTVTAVWTGAKSTVALAVSGLPAGVTAAYTPVSLPGSGSSVLKVTAAATAAPGTYNVKVTATVGTQTASSTFALTVAKPTFALSYGGGLYPSVNFGPNAPFTSQTIKLQTLPSNGFNAPIALSATGLPAGLTVTFAPATIAAGAVGSVGNSVATVAAANTVKGGDYPFTITATGGGVTQTVQYRASVFVRPSCQLATQNSIAFKAGAGVTLTLACTATPANATPLTLSLAGAPGGLTAKFSAPTISAGKTVALALSSTTAVTPGTYALTITTTEASGARQDLQVFAAIGTPVFGLSLSPAAVTGAVGSAVPVVAVITPETGFTNKVTIWIGSRPTGVTATFAPVAGGQSSTITLTIDKTAVPGTYPLTIGAIANTGFSRTVVSTLTIVPAPTLALTSSAAAVSLKAGGTAQVTLTAKAGGSFNAAVALSATGLPAGVTATFSKVSVAAPGNGSVTMTLTAAATAKLGAASLGAVGAGGGLSASAPIALTVAK